MNVITSTTILSQAALKLITTPPCASIGDLRLYVLPRCQTITITITTASTTAAEYKYQPWYPSWHTSPPTVLKQSSAMTDANIHHDDGTKASQFQSGDEDCL